MSGAVIYADKSYDQNQYNETIKRIRDIENAIISYFIHENQSDFYTGFLCPSSPEDDLSNPEFGKEIRGISCSTKNGIVKKGEYFLGAVPVRTIEIADYYMFDGWGNRFSFIINPKFIFTDEGETSTFASKFSDLNWLTENKLYYIISHGPNGKGAYNQYGFKNSISKNLAEENNSIFSKKTLNITDYSMTEEFDDVVVSKSALEFFRNISGGVLLSKSFCKIITIGSENNYNCSLLRSKVKKLCV